MEITTLESEPIPDSDAAQDMTETNLVQDSVSPTIAGNNSTVTLK